MICCIVHRERDADSYDIPDERALFRRISILQDKAQEEVQHHVKAQRREVEAEGGAVAVKAMQETDVATQTANDSQRGLELENPQPGNKLNKFSALSFGKKNGKWGLGGMFGQGDKNRALPPVEIPIADQHMVVKEAKKEVSRLRRDAEKQRHIMAQEAYRAQARAVMQKKLSVMQKKPSGDLEYLGLWRGNSATASFISAA